MFSIYCYARYAQLSLIVSYQILREDSTRNTTIVRQKETDNKSNKLYHISLQQVHLNSKFKKVSPIILIECPRLVLVWYGDPISREMLAEEVQICNVYSKRSSKLIAWTFLLWPIIFKVNLWLSYESETMNMMTFKPFPLFCLRF